MIYDDYISYTNEYRDKYGYDTVIFLQVGDFFELYAVQNDEEQAGADIFRIGDLCNLQVTRKNKALAENSRSNPYMAGFPLPIVHKHVQTLTQNGYTVVIIRQVTPPPNVRREVTEIISPSTNTTPTSSEGTYLMTCYFQNECDLLHVGIAGIDVTTGHSFVYEAYSSKHDPTYAVDEVYRILCAFTPKEVVVIGTATPTQQRNVANMLQGQSCTVHERWMTAVGMFSKCSYQNEVLRKAFPISKTNAGLLTHIEACHLEKLDSARVAFVYMIQFAYEHNEKLIEKIRVPEVLNSRSRLTLEYNSALQLNLVSCVQGEKPLMTLLNRCGTAFGARLFKERLLAPVLCPVEIGRRHSLIERFDTLEYVNKIHKQLGKIQDLERLSRRMILGTFSPLDWYALHASLQVARAIASDVNEMETMWDELISSYERDLNIEACSKYTLADIKGNVFHRNVYPDVDELEDQYTTGYEYIQNIANQITSCDANGGDGCLCRVECNDRDGYYLVITKKRWETAKKFNGIKLEKFETRPLSSSSSILRVTSADVQKASDNIIESQRKLSSITTTYFKQYVASWIETYQERLQTCIDWLAEIDVSCTNAKNAFEYGYVKPTIRQSSQSYVHCKSMRHPIIERINSVVDYVDNDVELGGPSSYDSLLLYGINSSGKSSFMKAIGLNVIMAQAGMYVACESMTLAPYAHIFTRISGADNIYRGMSSFTVEMTELNNILHRCDENSLVLGDELCAGTEAISGLAIVSAGIQYLSAKKTCFVFATHLHELVDIPIVKTIKGIRIAHMHIEIDQQTQSIVYHRKLQDGQGSRVYGLEVCSALGLPSNFMKIANEVRRHIQQIPSQLVKQSPSRYNTSVVVDSCAVCGAPASETHHIRYQCTAADNGAVALGVHMNRESNLAPICETCHQKEHRGQLKIHGYVQSSNGIQLQVSEIPIVEQAKSCQVDLYDHIRRGTSDWKSRTVTGVWKRISEATAVKKITSLLKTGDIDLEHLRGQLFDPTL